MTPGGWIEKAHKYLSYLEVAQIIKSFQFGCKSYVRATQEPTRRDAFRLHAACPPKTCISLVLWYRKRHYIEELGALFFQQDMQNACQLGDDDYQAEGFGALAVLKSTNGSRTGGQYLPDQKISADERVHNPISFLDL